jgi:Ca2+-binding RTX toxin-like protein
MAQWPFISSAKNSIMPIARINPEFTVNSTTRGDQDESSITVLSNGRFVVTWSDGSVPTSPAGFKDVLARIFNADGTQAVPDFVVNTARSGHQIESKVAALSNGRFVVTWSDYRSTGDTEGSVAIRARIFNGDGTQFVPDFLVNTTTRYGQFDSSVTTLADGRFVVTWSDDSETGGDTSGTAIRGRIFNANGTQSVPEFLVNTATRFQQSDSEVTALANGGFVVTWTDNSQTGGDTHFTAIRARVYNPDGTQLSPELLVNTTTLYSQTESRVTALAEGGFVVTWTSDNSNGSATQDIHACIFLNPNDTGLSQLPEFRVNTGLYNGQYQSHVTALEDGRFVVTWTDSSQGNPDFENIHASIFDSAGIQSMPEFVVNTRTFSSQTDSSVTAMADGRFIVTWSDNSTGSPGMSEQEIRAQIFDPRIYYGTSADETIIGGSMSDQYFGDGGNDVILGRDGDDYLTGNAGSDTLYGEGGSDQLYGGTDADIMWGGADNDTLGGGDGADVHDGGTGWNTASYSGDGGVTVVMYNMGMNTGAAAGDTFFSINALQGSRFTDVLIGDSLVNSIFGGAGGDWLDGTAGGDFLFGEAGYDHLVSRQQADFLYGGTGFDFVRLDYADTGLRTYLYDTAQNSGWAAGDVFDGIEGIVGSYFTDDLRGDSLQNIIYGLDGADFIVGLDHSDVLIGGDGQDLFHFVGIGDGGASGDVIQDFVSGQDRISVQGSFFGLGSPGGVAIDSFRFVEGTGANLATSQFIYNAATQQLFYDIDGTSAGAQVLLATLQAGATMASTDIIVI